jgi:hypothetical protein
MLPMSQDPKSFVHVAKEAHERHPSQRILSPLKPAPPPNPAQRV